MASDNGNRPNADQRRVRPAVMAAAATVVIALGMVAVALARDDQPHHTTPTGPSPALATPTRPSPVPPAGRPGATTPTPPVPASFRYQPLWPFGTAAEVTEWRYSYRSGGHSPWHLDPDATALAFTTGYLGFTGITTVVGHSIMSEEALVTVGYPIPGTAPGTAAVLHLAKWGAGPDAPWDVVGTQDSSLTLTDPAYGATVHSPLTVGGRITGVDENIRVQVREPNSPTPIGQTCCLPAGGQNTPWSATVSFHSTTAPTLTVVASTGGHHTDVERFAITGIHPAK